MWAVSSRESRHQVKAGRLKVIWIGIFLKMFNDTIAHQSLFDQVCCLLWVDEEPWSSFTRGNSIETDTNTNHRWTEHHWTHYVKKKTNARDICCLKFQITSGLMYCGRGDGSDFSVEVDQVATSGQMFRKNVDVSSLFLCLTRLKIFRILFWFLLLILCPGSRKHSVQGQLWEPVELQARVWCWKRLAHCAGDPYFSIKKTHLWIN